MTLQSERGTTCGKNYSLWPMAVLTRWKKGHEPQTFTEILFASIASEMYHDRQGEKGRRGMRQLCRVG
jgi:hypothetical protein